jgi:RNA polymerase sigma-70 factor (ECF subfamily)
VKESGTDNLILRAAAGDEEAVTVLVKQYHNPLRNFLLRMGCAPHTLEDVLQETFWKTLRALPDFRRQAEFTTWLYRIALNALRDQARRDSRRRETSLGENNLQLSTSDSTVESVEDVMARERVRQAVFSLPKEQRAAVLLRFYHGLSLQEIAAACGCPHSTAKSRLRLGLTKLRSLLEDIGGERKPVDKLKVLKGGTRRHERERTP